MIMHTFAMKETPYTPVTIQAWMFNLDCDLFCSWFTSIYLDLTRHSVSPEYENWMMNGVQMIDSGLNSPTAEGVDKKKKKPTISPVRSSAAACLSVAFFYKGDENTVPGSNILLEI